MRGIFRRLIILLIITLFASSISYGENPKYDILEPYMKVMAADDEFLWAAGGSGEDFMKILYKSSDYGESWSLVHRFNKPIEGLHISSNDIIFVSISDNRYSEDANCEIWRSTTRGSYFLKVLDLESGAATNWNFASDDEGYVFISEYGIKSGNNARRIYRSNNNGIKFQVIYDPGPILGYHNHIIRIDKNNNNIIYQSIGDDSKFIIRSTDRGNTWSSVIENYHPTSMIQIDYKILWGLDNFPCSGVLRYDTDTMLLDYSLITPKPYGGSIYDMLYVDGIIYAGTMSYEYDNWEATIFTSNDKGLSWENYIAIPRCDNIGVGIYSIVSQGEYIYAWVSMPIEENGVMKKYQGSIRFTKIGKRDK
ncbi:MAG TPA: hypothetical protein VFC79_09495 [Tissierellaceae bacterium]|nr:hypothetical protein [Tissierellaceae bacterium]